jgi:outer membrane cobalamin receptor
VSAYALHYTLKLFSNFTYFLNRPTTGDQFLQQEDRDVFGFSASRSMAHTLGSYQALTEFGLQARHDTIHAGLFDTQNRVTTGTTRVDDVRETLLGIYGQTGLEWLPKVRTLLGVRADSLNVDVNSALQPLNSGSAGSTMTSPKMSVILGPWNKTEFFVNTGAGFHSNDARGMTSRVDPRTGSALQPVTGLVKATGTELGVRSEAFAGLQSSMAIWQLDFDSELTYSGDAGTTAPKGPSRRYGVEWNNHWVARPGVLLDFDWAWTHARFNNPHSDGITTGTYVPNAVDEVATATLTFKNLGPWMVSLSERYIGSGALTADNSVRSSPSLLSNLRVMRTLKGKSTLALDVLNLFDRQYNDIEYYYATQLAGEPAPVNGKAVHPGEGRTFRLTLRIEL